MRNVILSMLLLLIPPALAAEPTISSSFSARQLPGWIETAWVQYRNEYVNGRYEEATKILEQVRRQASAEGIERFDLLAAVMIQEGEEALDREDANGAVQLGTAAKAWSPNDPAASFFLAKALFRRQPFQTFGALSEYLAGLSNMIHDFEHLFYLLGRLVLIFSAALIGSVLFSSLFSFIRYFPVLIHSLSEFRIFNRYAAWGLVLLLLILPLFLGAGPLMVLLMGVGLVWIFMSWSERLVAVGWVIVASLAGLWLSPMLSWFLTDPSSELMLISHVLQGNARGAGSAQAVLERGGYDQDALVLYSLALQKKREGDYARALDLYQKARGLQPDSSVLYNNIGNVQFLNKDYDQAVTVYQQALTKNPKDATAHYNLNLVYRELLRFDEAQQHYEQAQRIDRGLIQSFADRGKVVVDELYPVNVLWARIFSDSPLKRQQSSDLFIALLSPLPLNYSPLLGVCFIGGLVLLRFLFPHKYTATGCALCGKPICFHCQRRLLDLRVCHSCWETSKNIKRKADLREIKLRQRRSRRLARLISIFLPGGGHLYLKMAIRGFIFLSIFLTVLLTLLFQNRFVPMPGERGGIIGPGTIAVMLVVASTLYLSVFRDLNKLSEEKT